MPEEPQFLTGETAYPQYPTQGSTFAGEEENLFRKWKMQHFPSAEIGENEERAIRGAYENEGLRQAAESTATVEPQTSVEGIPEIPPEVSPEKPAPAIYPTGNNAIDPHTGKSTPVLTEAPVGDPFEMVKGYISRKIFGVPEKTFPYPHGDIFGTQAEHELGYVLSRWLDATFFGVPDLVYKGLKGEKPEPTTTAGAFMGGLAGTVGFLGGPYAVAAKITGSKISPTLEGLNTVTQILTKGGASLGVASGLSSILPSVMENGDLSGAFKDIVHSTAMGTLIGMIFPAMGVVENPVLRVGLTMAVLDKMRAGWGQWFTVDDVVKGVASGTIDKVELGKWACSFTTELYFALKTPSMRKNIEDHREQEVMRLMLDLKDKDLNEAIKIIEKDPGLQQNVEGITDKDIEDNFGTKENFASVYEVAKPPGGITMEETPGGEPIGGEIGRPPTSAILALTRKMARFWESQRGAIDLSTEEKAAAVEKAFNDADTELLAMRDKENKDLRAVLTRLFTDTSGNIKRELLYRFGDLGKTAVIAHDLKAGMPVAAAQEALQGVTRVLGGTSKEQELLMAKVAEARRVIAIDDYRQQGSEIVNAIELLSPSGDAEPELATTEAIKTRGLTPDYYRAYLEVLQKKDPENYKLAMERTDTYFKYFADLWDFMRDEGLTTDKLHDSLEGIQYSPRLFFSHVNQGESRVYGTLSGSGVQKLDQGSEGALAKNPRFLMQWKTAQVYQLAAENRANIAANDIAELYPGNGLFEKLPEGEEPPPGWEKIGFMVGGEQKWMQMKTEWAKEWLKQDPWMRRELSEIVSRWTGATIAKAGLTGYNPVWAALVNPPMDFAHIFMSTREYSPVLPVYTAQFAEDLAAVAHDVFTRTGCVTDYIRQGGGLELLTQQGEMSKGTRDLIEMELQKIKGDPTYVMKTQGEIREFIEGLGKVLAWTGNTTELWSRMALRHRAIKNGKDEYEATWIARNYMDYAQSGSLTKALNSGVIYLNAAVVALRGPFRNISQEILERKFEGKSAIPWDFMVKASQVAGLAVASYEILNHYLDDYKNTIPDRVLEGYTIIPIPGISKVDENGQRRYLYLKIRKDQTQRIIHTLAEAGVAMAHGDPYDFDRVWMAAQDLLPVAAVTDLIPPIPRAIATYQTNWNYWTNRPISEFEGKPTTYPWPESRNEQAPGTSPTFKAVGKVTGLSPPRLQTATNVVLSSTNPLVQLVTMGADYLTKDKSIPERDKEIMDRFSAMPGASRIMGWTDPNEASRKEFRKAQEGDTLERQKLRVETDKYAERYFSTRDPSVRKEFNSWINTRGWEGTIGRTTTAFETQAIQERLRSRFETYGKLYGQPNRSFWLNLDSIPPEKRAEMYWVRLNEADPEGRKVLERQYGTYVSGKKGNEINRFIMELNKLKREGE